MSKLLLETLVRRSSEREHGPCATKQRVLLLLMGVFHIALWTIDKFFAKTRDTFITFLSRYPLFYRSTSF